MSGTLKPEKRYLQRMNQGTRIWRVELPCEKLSEFFEISGFVVVKKGNRGGTFVQDVASNRKMVEYFSGHVRAVINLRQLTEARY